MVSPTVAALLEALRQHRLLDARQLAQLDQQLAGKQVEARLLARKLVEQGWLTSFQANQLLLGRASDLVVGSYILLDRLGEGGMGQVFRARHRHLDRIVALKLIRKERLANPNAVKRFHREIQLAAQLNHPHIVLAYDADQLGDTHFFTMECVDGTDLGQLVKRSGPLPVATACDYIRQAALGLQHAHERGLVHRDIKPSNLLLGARDGVIKVLDLGLARAQVPLGDSGQGQILTQENTVVGTPDYMAPEQILNPKTADIRADLYSLGCTLYFLLSGRVPFPGDSLGEKLVRHQLHEAEPLERLRPDVPPALVAVVRRLLAKRPEERFQTPAELAVVLAGGVPASATAIRRAAPPGAHVLPAAVPAPPRTTPESGTLEGATTTKPLPRSRPARRWLLGGLAAGVCVLGLLCAALVGWFWLFQSSSAGGTSRRPTAMKATQPETVQNSLKMKLVLVPAGDFMMGSPEAEVHRQPHEGPQHPVAITSPFYLGVHEVTMGQFEAFVKATGYQTEGERDGAGAFGYTPTGETVKEAKYTWRNPGWPQSGAHPVSCVSRHDAGAFCQWLSKQEGKTYRLPTEAEWEYACRAGTTTPFHCGPTLVRAHFNHLAKPDAREPGIGGLHSSPVGSFPPNAFGLHDMHGNVWEWCADWYDEQYYRQSPRRDPAGPANGSLGVFRGGGFEVGSDRCRSAFRFPLEPSFRHVVVGFRVVCKR